MACVDIPVETFFPRRNQPGLRMQAKTICRLECGVTQQCAKALLMADSLPEQGIHAGVDVTDSDAREQLEEIADGTAQTFSTPRARCGACAAPLRQRSQSLQDFPGTRRTYAHGLCEPCYRQRRVTKGSGAR